VILIHPNATVLATEAADAGSAGYDPRGALAFYYEEARNFYGTNQYIVALADKSIRSGIQQANVNFANTLLANAVAAGNTNALTTASNSNALASPFGYSTFNLRPFDQIVAEAPTTAGAIYLIIFVCLQPIQPIFVRISLMCFMRQTFLISPMWKEAFTPLANKLNRSSELFLKVLVPILAYFWLSLMYSLVSLAFQLNFNIKYGHSQYPAASGP